MLDWPPGRIGPARCPIISPHVQIESKEMWPVWVPGSPRRPKDAEDIVRLRQALQSRQPQSMARRATSESLCCSRRAPSRAGGSVPAISSGGTPS